MGTGLEREREREREKERDRYEVSLLLVRQGSIIGTIASSRLQLYLMVGGACISVRSRGEKNNLQL